jgi:hypothetical protein
MANNSFNEVPFIRLSGSWLKDAGFSIGNNYRVEINQNKLILEVIE